MEITVHEQDIIRAASEGMDAFLMLIHDRIMEGIGGRLDDTTMPMLNGNQVTLLAYVMFREEVMDGGFVQLIHNGYGPFIFNLASLPCRYNTVSCHRHHRCQAEQKHEYILLHNQSSQYL